VRRFTIERNGQGVGEGCIWSDGRVHDEYMSGYNYRKGDLRVEIDPYEPTTEPPAGKLISERTDELLAKCATNPGATEVFVDALAKRYVGYNPSSMEMKLAMELAVLRVALDERLGRAPGKAI
jgi:hypothetical protein